jgi:hypothetical protein
MTARQEDQNGYITIENNPISRSGVFQYLGRNVGDADPDRIVNVYRPAEELQDPECLASFQLVPIIDDHVMLGKLEQGLVPAEEKGVHGTTGQTVDFKDGVLYSNLKIFSEKLASLIRAGKKALSLGYRCVYEYAPGVFEGQSYDYVQRKLRGNHLALVDEARCDVAVLDSRFTYDHLDINPTKTEDMKMADDKKKEGQDQDALTLEGLAAKVDALASAVATMAEKLKGDSEGEDKAKDEAELAKQKEEADKKAADEAAAKEAEAKKAEGMDAKIKGLESTVESLKKDAVKTVMGEIAQRDALAEKLSHHVGAFDHKDKTLAEVAAYGVEKLGLKCEKGQERAALDGFLHNRKAPTQGDTFTLDAATAKSGEDAVNAYFQPKA